MSRGKTIDKVRKLPRPKIQTECGSVSRTLPYNGSFLTDKSFSFSFACFDRQHELFNLGNNSSPDGVVSGKWFLSLLDCLKSVSNQRISDLFSSIHDLHRVDWKKTNTPPPPHSEQLEYWQFRINKSRGRVIGFKIDNTFYVVWLDPHHNLTNSEGYGKVEVHRPPR